MTGPEPSEGTAAATTERMPVTTPLIVLASMVVIVAGLRAAAGFLVPILSAVLLTLVLAPAVAFLVQRRVPKGLAIAIVTLLVVASGAGVGVVVGDALVSFSGEIPARAAALDELQDHALEVLRRFRIDVPAEGPLNPALDARKLLGLVQSLLGAIRNLVANGFILIMLVVFGLLQIGRTRATVEQVLGTDSVVPDVIEHYANEVLQYLKVKALMSLGTGLFVWLALVVLRIEYAMLWGLMAFLLNFIPNIGSLIAAIPPIALGLLDHGVGRAVLVAAAIIGINTVFSNVLEPRLMGRSFGISPWMVFVALLFWAYVLGPVGMILAIPLTVALKLGFEMNDRTKWIAALMA